MRSPVTIDSSSGRAALDDLAVDRDLLAGADDDDVADTTSSTGDLELAAVADHPRGPRLQADQLADRLAGPGLGARLEQPAEQDQGEDDADRLEVDLAQLARRAGPGTTVTKRL